MIPDISPSKYRTILLQHLLKKSEGEEARSPENFGWGCVPCVLKPWHCFPTKIIEFLSTLFVDFILDCCSQKGFYMTKNHPTPLPPPQLHRPRFQQGTKPCPISGLKGYGATQTYKINTCRSYEGVPHLPPGYKDNGANDYITSLKYLFLFLSW